MILDLPHAMSNTPTLLTGLLITAALLADTYWTIRTWRTR